MSSHVWPFVVSLFCLLPLSLVPLLSLSLLPVLCPELQLPRCRDRRALNPMRTRRMRGIAPWRAPLGPHLLPKPCRSRHLRWEIFQHRPDHHHCPPRHVPPPLPFHTTLLTRTLREILDWALAPDTQKNMISTQVQLPQFRTCLPCVPAPLRADRPTARIDVDTSNPSPYQEKLFLRLFDMRGTPNQPMQTTHPDVLLHVPTPRTHRRALLARSIGSLSGYRASRKVKITFSPPSMANSGNSRCSTASPSSIEYTKGPLASFVSVDMVIIFDRHHVFHRFRSHPTCPSATEALEATNLICARSRHHLHSFSDTSLRKLRRQFWLKLCWTFQGKTSRVLRGFWPVAAMFRVLRGLHEQLNTWSRLSREYQ